MEYCSERNRLRTSFGTEIRDRPCRKAVIDLEEHYQLVRESERANQSLTCCDETRGSFLILNTRGVSSNSTARNPIAKEVSTGNSRRHK